MKILKELPPVWLRSLIIAVLLLGIFFRVVNIDRKVFWGDEVLSMLRISGYTQAELFQQLPHGQVIGIEDLQKYQKPKPLSGLGDTVKSLAAEDPLQTPLYFVLGRLWVDWFGSSPTTIRSLSVLFSLLVFPCLYWLCRELFESPLVGWMAIALIAVSPFQVLYGQEARQYSLWTAAILLGGAALLRAMRINTKLSWVMYAATTLLGLYTHFFHVFVALGHGIYVVITERCRLSKTMTAYLLASVAAFLAFVPWVMNLKSEEPSWTAKAIPLFSLLRLWGANTSRIFFDLNFDANDPLIYQVPPIIILLILLGYAIYFICCQAPKRIWIFVLTLIGATALALILPDLILGGRRSSVSRYLIPSYLGIQLAVAYLLATKIVSNGWQRKLWQLISALLISAGVVSCAFSSQADTWWHKKPNHLNPQIARIVNRDPQPLLISDDNAIYWLISLSYLLDAKVRFQLVGEQNIPVIPAKYRDVFLFNPSKKLPEQLEEKMNFKIKPVFKPGGLWRGEKV